MNEKKSAENETVEIKEMKPDLPANFIRHIVTSDVENKINDGRVVTRFPPEPNGYLHIGHAKSICLNFGLSQEFSGHCNLRFDDTNPVKEDQEFVDAIKRDISWLGFEWDGRALFASDYFEQLYRYAEDLIQVGKAFVCELSPEDLREYRGTLKEPGENSPFRDRSVAENLDLFRRMRAGEFGEGRYVLRAKIDMSSPNISLRDPTIYRIRKTSHHRTGDEWCIYPMYDFQHCLSDSIEGVTHSLCSQEFESNRPLYDWFIEQLDVPSKPRQIEFARLELTHTVLSKRKLSALVEEGHVIGWDDPRLLTLSGMRRRGYTARSIREFLESVGVAKANSTVAFQQLEHFVRKDLNQTAKRVMAVLDPIKLIIENYPQDQTEEMDAVNNPEDPDAGNRKIHFSRELYIEKSDFMEDPPRKYFRLAPGKEVRLKHGYYVTCTGFEKDENGEVTVVYCTYDPETRGGWSDDGRKVKGTLHWVSAAHALNATIRKYDHLFQSSNPEAGDFLSLLSSDSLEVLEGCKVERSLREADLEGRFQFMRKGYFCLDPESTPDNLFFNQTVALRDSWAKKQKGK